MKYADFGAPSMAAGRFVAPALPAAEPAILNQYSGILGTNGCHGSDVSSMELFVQRAVMTLIGLPSIKPRMLATMSGK